mgnify:FL=1
MMKRKAATRTAPAPKSSPLKTAFNYASIFVLAGVFVLGIGIGIAFSSTTITDTRNVASREFIDRAAPNAELCVQYGASAMVMDTRLFVSLNPFNVYVSQPSMRPGCVLRTNSWNLLEERRLVTNEQVRDCKNRMNTFGFTGDLGNSPDVTCVYQNDGAKNFYLTQSGGTPGQTEQF